VCVSVCVYDTIYQGDWVINLRHTHNTHTHTHTHTHQGDWVNDLRHGEGILTYPNGEKYSGQAKKKSSKTNHQKVSSQ
jgi:hypothetical protein